MITQEQYNRIERYLDGKLTEEELQAFLGQLDKDEELAEALFLQEQIKTELTNTGFQQFRETLTAVEETVYTSVDESALLETAEDEIIDENAPHPEGAGVYTLDDLLEMFQPVKHYEKAIAEAEFAGVVRAGGMDVITPENGSDCSDNITFELINAVEEPIKIVVENSEEDVVIREKMQPGETKLTIDTSQLPPGRYYWKLKSKEYGTMLGMFFVQKGLMPQSGE